MTDASKQAIDIVVDFFYINNPATNISTVREFIQRVYDMGHADGQREMELKNEPVRTT